jgi:hypothetical protein
MQWPFRSSHERVPTAGISSRMVLTAGMVTCDSAYLASFRACSAWWNSSCSVSQETWSLPAPTGGATPG